MLPGEVDQLNTRRLADATRGAISAHLAQMAQLQFLITRDLPVSATTCVPAWHAGVPSRVLLEA